MISSKISLVQCNSVIKTSDCTYNGSLVDMWLTSFPDKLFLGDWLSSALCLSRSNHPKCLIYLVFPKTL